MNIFGYNIEITKTHIFIFLVIVAWVILIICLVCLFLLILFVCIMFVMYYMFNAATKYVSTFFDNYTKKSQKVLDKYGDYKVTNIYILRKPLPNIITFTFNILSLYKYRKKLEESMKNVPYHTLLVFELEMENDAKKFILLEKMDTVILSEKVFINEEMEVKRVKLSKKENKMYTLRYILDKTKKRMGTKDFFNWDMKDNNCQNFTKEILTTIKRYKKHEDFIFRSKIISQVNPSGFVIYLTKGLCIIYNMLLSLTYWR
jgi:hypothetical protein